MKERFSFKCNVAMQHRPKSDGREPVARALGQTFATIQHLADLTFEWGSRKLKNLGSDSASRSACKGLLGCLKHAGRIAARFVGTMGDAYYEWYEKLKARRSMHKG